MNYSRTAINRRKNQIVFRRILISWVIVLLIGATVGFLIGISIKAVGASDTDETVIETSTPMVTSTPINKKTHIEETSEPQPTTELVSLGEFRITAYCHCEKYCGDWSKDRPTSEDGKLLVYTASGDLAVEGVTIAADTNILPFGTEIIIDGKKYIVQDRGRVIKNNRIDVYFENHQDALEFGVQYKEIFTERMIEND
jgi:Uncharacterized protein conserved in bacteria